MPSRLPETVERWPVERLLPYAANARTHPDDQIVQIAGSIAEFGFNVPCLVDERGVLIAGHGRLLAARKLRLTEVPVIRLDHLTDAQARAFRIADNQIAVNAGWDDATLSAELARLKEDGVDLELLGFPESELDRLLDGLGGESGASGDEDDVPEPPVEPVTRPGDLWRVGDHRLLCGDATVATDVDRLLGGDAPHLMVTDPPYGVDYDPAWRNEAGVSATARTGIRSAGPRLPVVGEAIVATPPNWRTTNDCQAIRQEPDQARATEEGREIAAAFATRRTRAKAPTSPANPKNAVTPGHGTVKGPRTGTKQAELIAMLERAEGATLEEIIAATGWQAHTVRGAISGAIKKKLGFTVDSDKVDSRGRVYRIVR